MKEELMSFIAKRKKAVAERLMKEKPIPLAAYFIVHGVNGLSEIIIPGIESFSEMKQLIPAYVERKWRQYIAKSPMKLVAVVIESHIFMSQLEYKGKDMSKEARNEWAKNEAKQMPCAPSEDPHAIRAIGFMVFYETDSEGAIYPYEKNGKHYIFKEPIEGVEFIAFGNFKGMYPTIK